MNSFDYHDYQEKKTTAQTFELTMNDNQLLLLNNLLLSSSFVRKQQNERKKLMIFPMKKNDLIIIDHFTSTINPYLVYNASAIFFAEKHFFVCIRRAL